MRSYGAALYWHYSIVYKGINIMYYCNGYYFDNYNEARRYADFLLNHAGIYRAIFTRDEMIAHNMEVAQ